MDKYIVKYAPPLPKAVLDQIVENGSPWYVATDDNPPAAAFEFAPQAVLPGMLSTHLLVLDPGYTNFAHLWAQVQETFSHIVVTIKDHGVTDLVPMKGSKVPELVDALNDWCDTHFPPSAEPLLREGKILFEQQYKVWDVNNKRNIGLNWVSEKLRTMEGLATAVLKTRYGCPTLAFSSSAVKRKMGLASGDHDQNKLLAIKWCKETHGIDFKTDHEADTLVYLVYYINYGPDRLNPKKKPVRVVLSE
jgi:hypothetical protein